MPNIFINFAQIETIDNAGLAPILPMCKTFDKTYEAGDSFPGVHLQAFDKISFLSDPDPAELDSQLRIILTITISVSCIFIMFTFVGFLCVKSHKELEAVESQAKEALRSMQDQHVREAKNFEEQMQDQEKAKLARQQAVYQQSLAQASRDAQMQSAQQFQEKELRLRAEAESALLSVQGQAQTALDAEKQKLYIAEQGADYWKNLHNNHQMKPIVIEVNFKRPKNLSSKTLSPSNIGLQMFNVVNLKIMIAFIV